MSWIWVKLPIKPEQFEQHEYSERGSVTLKGLPAVFILLGFATSVGLVCTYFCFAVLAMIYGMTTPSSGWLAAIGLTMVLAPMAVTLQLKKNDN